MSDTPTAAELAERLAEAEARIELLEGECRLWKRTAQRLAGEELQ